MKCSKCNGKGYYTSIVNLKDLAHLKDIVCEECNGKGTLPMTNEEWFCSLSTEEKTDVFFSIAFACSRCGDEAYSNEEKIKTCPFGKVGCTEKDWEKWLKEIHKK